MATYYVKVGGGTGSGLDDANAWSYAKLFATSLAAGDIVLFKRGDTFVGQHYAKPGSSGNPVVYDAYGSGAKPIISGFTTLTSWTLSSGNIYYASLDVSMLHGVTLDNEVKGMGRYPDSGYLTYSGATANTSINGTTVGAIPFDPTGAEVVIRKYRWVLDRHIVTSRSGNTLNYSSTDFYGSNSAYNPVAGNGYFIQGHLSCLTQEGDWYYDNAANRLYMHFGSGTPSGRTVKASTVNQVVPLNSADYIEFNNIDFEGGNIAININSSTGIGIYNCGFNKQGTCGIYGITSSNIDIAGITVYDSLNNAMQFESCDNVTADGFGILNAGIIPGAGASSDGSYTGVRVIGDGVTLRNFTIVNSGYCGVYHMGNDLLIERFFVDHTCLVKDDGAGIYTVNSSNDTMSNRIIRQGTSINAIGAKAGTEAYISYEDYGKAACIYLDDYSNDVEVSDCFCMGSDWAGIFVHSAYNNQLLNNITFDCAVGLYFMEETAITRDMAVTGNKFIAKTADQRAMYIWMFASDNPELFGTFNNNVYARPIDDTTVIGINREYSGGGGETHISLATWKSTYDQDADSTASPMTISDEDELRADYNDTGTAVDVSLTGIWKDFDGTNHSGSIEIPAYGGNVLAYVGVSTAKILTVSGKRLTFEGKTLTI